MARTEMRQTAARKHKHHRDDVQSTEQKMQTTQSPWITRDTWQTGSEWSIAERCRAEQSTTNEQHATHTTHELEQLHQRITHNMVYQKILQKNACCPSRSLAYFTYSACPKLSRDQITHGYGDKGSRRKINAKDDMFQTYLQNNFYRIKE